MVFIQFKEWYYFLAACILKPTGDLATGGYIPMATISGTGVSVLPDKHDPSSLLQAPQPMSLIYLPAGPYGHWSLNPCFVCDGLLHKTTKLRGGGRMEGHRDS